MSQAPIMPLMTDALLADTQHLSAEEIGAYMFLLLSTWRNNGKPLPDENKRLSRICRVTQRRWQDKLRPVLSEFFDLTDGTWRQKRLENEWARVQRQIDAKRKNGKKGGRPSDKTRTDNTFGTAGNLAENTGKETPPSILSNSLGTKETSQAAGLPTPKLGEPTHTHTQTQVAEDSPVPYREPPPRGPNADQESRLENQNRRTGNNGANENGTRQKRGTRIAADWRPNEEGRKYACQSGYSNEQIDELADAFKDYWTAEAGRRASKRDWSAAWRSWLRKDIEFRGTPGPSNVGGTTRGIGSGGRRQASGSVAAAARNVLAGRTDKGMVRTRIRF